ncbi:hypothetical protein ACPA9J_24595 [Pseudomonas aeruginosa]
MFLYGGVGLGKTHTDACGGQPPAEEEPERQGGLPCIRNVSSRTW